MYLSKIKNDYIVFNGYRYFKTKYGYYIKRIDGRTNLHRDKWEHYNGPIPKNHFIHHKNHDKSDNRLCNLEPMERGEHSKHHNIHKIERKCSIENCDNKYWSNGCCQRHHYYYKQGNIHKFKLKKILT